jgi:hypothetical protein
VPNILFRKAEAVKKNLSRRAALEAISDGCCSMNNNYLLGKLRVLYFPAIVLLGKG